jgi:hypothetical protein
MYIHVFISTYVYIGADLAWISLFPNESEVLYPPLTYMQPTGRSQVVEVDGFHYTIVEVRVTSA